MRPACSGEAIMSPHEGVTFEALAYIEYSYGKKPLSGDTESNCNSFQVTRGYLTFKREATPWLGFRYTLDVHQDDAGNYRRRDKYLYAELSPRDFGFLTHMKSEIGIGHMPWLDFEEHINPYRCQGTMAIERAGTFNSADVGVSLRGCFGESMPNAKERTGNSHYAGRYGSWHLGLYNGGGYHATENNENKALEGRLTVRPLPDVVPGLQLSYLGIFGKGNVVEPAAADMAASGIPDYKVHLGMLSFEHPALIVTGQIFTTVGNAEGNWTDPVTGEALTTSGYSAFANWKLPGSEGRWSLFGRYDHFDADADDVIACETAYDMVFGGIAYDLYKGNLLMLGFETTDYADNALGKGRVPTAILLGEGGESLGNLGKDQKIQIVFQIKL
jgi:hypothetical protein